MNKRFLQNVFHADPLIVLQLLEKTTMPTSVTGDAAFLFHAQQYDIVVAIQPNVFDHLLMT